MSIRTWIGAFALATLPLAAQAATLAAVGSVTSFIAPPGFDNSFGLDDPLEITATYLPSDPGCNAACTLNDVIVSLNGAEIINVPSPGGDFTAAVSSGVPTTFDGEASLGDVFNLTNVIISFGDFTTSSRSFVITADQGIGFATGTYTVSDELAPVPVPAGLPLLLTGVAMVAVVRRARRRA